MLGRREQFAATILLCSIIMSVIPFVNAQDLEITDSQWGIEALGMRVRIHGHLENVGLVTHYMPMVTATLYAGNAVIAQSTTYCTAATFPPGDVCWFALHFSNLPQLPTSYSLSVGSAL